MNFNFKATVPEQKEMPFKKNTAKLELNIGFLTEENNKKIFFKSCQSVFF